MFLWYKTLSHFKNILKLQELNILNLKKNYFNKKMFIYIYYYSTNTQACGYYDDDSVGGMDESVKSMLEADPDFGK